MNSFNERELKKHKVFLEIAKTISKLSTCQFTQVGAVLVDKEGTATASYNGTPSGVCHCTEHSMEREDHGRFADDNEVHAEMNAILKSIGRDLKGATIYTTISPCMNCLKHIAQVGINKVVTSAIYWRSSRMDVEEKCKLYGIEFILLTDEGESNND